MVFRSIFGIVALATVTVGCGIEADFLPATQPPSVELATAEQEDLQQVVPGSYIVAFRNQLPGNQLHFSTYLDEYRSHYTLVADRYLSDPRIKDIHFITSLDLARDDSPDWSADFGQLPSLQFMWSQKQIESVPASIMKVDFSSAADAASMLAEWDAGGVIWYAEPNYQSTLSAGPFDGMSATYQKINTPWHTAISLGGAFDTLATNGKGSEDVPIVAVMDSGVDYTHKQLASQMWVNEMENQSGCEGDKYGCNTTVAKKGVLGNGDVFPLFTDGPGIVCPRATDSELCARDCCHGTHVAGIIAAQPLAESTVAGVCPICKIMAIRLVEKNAQGVGSIQDASIIAGLKYITRFRRNSSNALAVRVINASFGKFQRSKTTSALIRVLSKVGSGTVLVGAAGNEDTMKMQYPAAYNDAIAVSNINNSGIRHTTSNYGRWVDIAAPGTDIMSTVPGPSGDVESKTGTSMSAPVVAGVAALMLINNPEMSFNELRSKLINASNPAIYENEINALYYPKIRGEVARVPLLGAGLVNAPNAVKGTKSGNLPVATALDRVSDRCGTLQLGTAQRARGIASILLLILIPTFLLLTAAKHTKT